MAPSLIMMFLPFVLLYFCFLFQVVDGTVVSTVSNLEGNTFGGGNRPMKASYGKLMMWFFLVSDALTFSAFLVTYGFARNSYHVYKGKIEEFVFSDAYWPIPEKLFNAFPGFHGTDLPLAFVAMMTMILIFSSVTMVLAVEAGNRMDRKHVQGWLLLTIIGGIAFIGSQAWEWSHFIHGNTGYVKMEDGSRAWINNKLVHDETVYTIGDELVLNVNQGWEGKEQLVKGADAVEILNNGKLFMGANLSENEYGPQLFADLFFFITGFHGTHVLSGIILLILIFYNSATGVYEARGHYEMVEKVGLYWHFVDLVWVFVFTFFYLI